MITGLRSRGIPGSRQDYRLAAQLKKTSGGAYALSSNLQAGSESRPSTSLQLAGHVHAEHKPLPFKIFLILIAFLTASFSDTPKIVFAAFLG